MSHFSRIIWALLFLAGPQRRVERGDPRRFERLAGAVMLWGAAWGLGMAALWETIFKATWHFLYNWILSATACAAATCLLLYLPAGWALVETAERGLWAAIQWLFRKRGGRLMAWAARLAERERSWLILAGVLGLTVGMAGMLNAAVRSDPDWPTQLPQQWAWLWPRAVYRVLLLTPVWGAWSMLAAVQFHRPNDRTDAPARHFAGAVSPVAAAAALALPLAGSFIYLMFLPTPLRFVPPAGAVLAALGGGSLIVRSRRGLTRPALLATNLLTQLGFVGAYLAVR